MVQVLLTKSAQLDLAEAVDWYNANAPHVVDRFRGSLRGAMHRIANNPLQFSLVLRDVRKAMMAGFPYLILFQLSDDAAFVIAMFHMSRDHRSWQTRA
jgi:plasmid stabilization system protein ParE